MTNHDPVNHPTHYASDAQCSSCGESIEAIDVIRHLGFNVGNAMKYIWRAGKKAENAEVQDLKKAVWYLQDQIATLQGEKNPNVHRLSNISPWSEIKTDQIVDISSPEGDDEDVLQGRELMNWIKGEMSRMLLEEMGRGVSKDTFDYNQRVFLQEADAANSILRCEWIEVQLTDGKAWECRTHHWMAPDHIQPIVGARCGVAQTPSTMLDENGRVYYPFKQECFYEFKGEDPRTGYYYCPVHDSRTGRHPSEGARRPCLMAEEMKRAAERASGEGAS